MANLPWSTIKSVVIRVRPLSQLIYNHTTTPQIRQSSSFKHFNCCSNCYRVTRLNGRVLLHSYNNAGRHYSSLSVGGGGYGDKDKKKLKGTEEKRGPLSAFMDLPKDTSKAQHEIFGDDGDWIKIYRFGHIQTARVIQRIKIYQTAFTCFLALPIAFFSSLHGTISPEILSVVVSGCGIACSMLYVMGTMFSNLVGIIYVTDKDPEIVRIAHMNFWGTREDEVYKKLDFVPFSDLPDNIFDAYVKLRLYSDPDHILKISIKYGEIYNEERFFEIFGGNEYYGKKNEPQG